MSISKLIRLHSKIHKPVKILSDEEIKLKTKLEGSFHEFVKWSWDIIEADSFIDGWHIKSICDHLELASYFKIRILVINVPPGTMKSTLLSMFNAWVWTTRPHTNFLGISGNESLAIKDSVRAKRIIESEKYQKLWGDKTKIRSDSNSKGLFENIGKGIRFAASMLGNVRGHGGKITVIDDGNTDEDYTSDVTREAKNEFLDANIFLRRRGSVNTIIIVQQRIHQKDLTAHVLSKAEALDKIGTKVVHLRLPMEFEVDNRCVTIPLKDGDIPWEDPRKEDGELLWPNFLTKRLVEETKIALGDEYHIAGQLQQRPSPRDGGIFKKEWFKQWVDEYPLNINFVIQSWDTALTVSKDSCYSACTTWGLFDDENGYGNLILLNAWRGKLEYPDLKEMVKRCSQDYKCQDLNSPIGFNKPDMILIEKAANGESLIQDLRRSGISAIPFNPKSHGFEKNGAQGASKLTRARIASSFIQDGFVWLPMKAPNYNQYYKFAEMFLTAALNFPRGDGADIIDTTSQVIIKLFINFDINYHGQKYEEVRKWQNINREAARLNSQSKNRMLEKYGGRI